MFESGFASSGVAASVHSATAVELSDGRIRAFWYGGTREGATDVEIYTSVLDAGRGSWSREVSVASRAETQRDVARYVKKLGNPVVSRDRDGELWLYFVSVSIGGWSGSAINVRTSDDEGESWGPVRRLVTSPFLNISTLVRGPAVHYTDGTQAIPVYHELLGKYGEYLWLGRDGRVLDKARLSWGHSSLQPVVVPLDAAHALGLMRKSGDSPPRILAVDTGDAGRSWSAAVPTSLANPDAAIAAVRTSWGELLVAFNDSELDRSNLSLALSDDDGESWEVVHVLDPPEPIREADARFAYPWLLETTDGEIQLLYTWNRYRIVHARFNREWLRPHR
jgi:predicted neuraminidase